MISGPSLYFLPSPSGNLVVLEECLGSGDLHARSLDKCQSTRLLNSDRHTLIPKLHGHNASHKRGECFHSLERGLLNFL